MTTIGIDMDGVLANFAEGFIRVANELWPRRFKRGYQPTTWNWADVLTEKEVTEVWEAIRKTPNFFLSLPPISDNVAALYQRLTSKKPRKPVTWYFITSRIPTLGLTPQSQTRQWLDEHMIWTGSVIVVKGSEQKGRICKAVGIDAIIDDLPSTARDCAKICRSYLLTQPWNETLSAGEAQRVATLEEFLEIELG